MNKAEVRSVGNYFSEGLALCRRGYFTILLAGLLVFIVAIVLGLAMLLPLVLMLGENSVIAMGVAGVWAFAVFGTLYASFTLLTVKLARGEIIKARQVLTQLRNIPKVMLTALSSYTIMGIGIIVGGLTMGGLLGLIFASGINNAVIVWGLLGVVYLLMLAIVLPLTMGMMFAPVKVLDHDAGIGQAIMYCLRQMWRHYGKLLLIALGIFFINMIVNIPGMIFPSAALSVLEFLIGIFLLLPYVVCIYAEVYRDHFAETAAVLHKEE